MKPVLAESKVVAKFLGDKSRLIFLSLAAFQTDNLLKGNDIRIQFAQHFDDTVRAYAPVLAAGTVLCLTFAAAVTIPLAVTLLARGVTALSLGNSTGTRLDGAATLLTIGGFWALWCHTWCVACHGPRVVAWRTRLLRSIGRR